MNVPSSHSELGIRAAEIFQETDEPIYSVPVSFPMPHPVRYIPMGPADAAMEALIEADPRFVSKDIREIIAKINIIEEEVESLAPGWEYIYESRYLGSVILNSYYGSDQPFSLN